MGTNDKDRSEVKIKVEEDENGESRAKPPRRHYIARNAKLDVMLKIIKLGRGFSPVYYGSEDGSEE